MKIGYIRVSTQEQNTMRQEVLVESISRFARNTKDLLELVEQLYIQLNHQLLVQCSICYQRTMFFQNIYIM